MQQKEAELRARQEAQAVSDRNLALTKLRETHQIDEKSWDLAYKDLDSTLPANEPITPTMVVNKVKEMQVSAKSAEIVNTLTSKYGLGSDDSKAIEAVTKLYPQLSLEEVEEELKASIDELSKKEKQDKLAKKLEEKKLVPKEEVSEDSVLDNYSAALMSGIGLK